MNDDLYTAQRALATRKVELRKRIDASGDADLLQLQEQHDFLWMSHEMGREIEAERAVIGREIAPKDNGCACNICAVHRGLDVGLAVVRVAREFIDEMERWFEDDDESAVAPVLVVARLRQALSGEREKP